MRTRFLRHQERLPPAGPLPAGGRARSGRPALGCEPVLAPGPRLRLEAAVLVA